MAEAANGAAPAAETPDQRPHPHGEGFWALTLGSIGVVFGDIGTSPLYAMREALAHSRSGGTAVAHAGSALGQRVRKTQPLGGLAGLGISPFRISRVLWASGSGEGIADIRACV